MDEREQGNVSLAVLGTVLGLLCCLMFGVTYIHVHLVHHSAAAAADAGALAATEALRDVFIKEITPDAYRKLDELMQQIRSDPNWGQSEEKSTIIRNTIPSKLQEELLAGRRGLQVSVPSLLGYSPFFSEQELGKRLYGSFKRSAVSTIIPQVRKYMAENGSTGRGAISFPVYGKIEVEAFKQFESPFLKSLLTGRIRDVGGKGYAIYIEELDGYGIRYDVASLPVWQIRFE